MQVIESFYKFYIIKEIKEKTKIIQKFSVL